MTMTMEATTTTATVVALTEPTEFKLAVLSKQFFTSLISSKKIPKYFSVRTIYLFHFSY